MSTQTTTHLAARFEAKREGFVPDHEFKSHPSVFWPAARGEKTFEYRRDDRGGYEVGQTVRLRCYLPLSGAYIDTPPLDRRITNILRGGEFELPKGFCILSLAPAFTEARDMARADAAGEGAALQSVTAWLAEQEMAARGRANDCRPSSDQEHWHRAQAAAYEAAHAYAVVRPARAAAPPPPAQQGSSSPLSQGDTVGELERLSAAAPKGPWHPDEYDAHDEDGGPSEIACDGICVPSDYFDPESIASCNRSVAVFVCALVNAYRAGHLVPASLAAARDGGAGAGDTEAPGAAACRQAAQRASEQMAWAKPTPDPRKEALAVLEGLDPEFGPPERYAKVLRHLDFNDHADRIEAALATLSATDQVGEVR